MLRTITAGWELPVQRTARRGPPSVVPAPTLEVRTEDGLTVVTEVTQIKVPDASLQDNGGGSVSMNYTVVPYAALILM